MPAWKPWLVLCAGILALLPPEAARTETALAALDWQRPAFASLERDLDCLALNIYWEARSESLLGQVAVAAVTLNRVAAPDFPDSVCEVVFQGEERGRHLCQFSWRCDGRTDQPRNLVAWQEARRVARLALSRQVEDPTDGALWYHADHVLPDWAGDMAMRARIGHHLFYGQRPRLALQAQRDRYIPVPLRRPGLRPGLAAASRAAFTPRAGGLRIDPEGEPGLAMPFPRTQRMDAFETAPGADILGAARISLAATLDSHLLGRVLIDDAIQQAAPRANAPPASFALAGAALQPTAAPLRMAPAGRQPSGAVPWSGERGAVLTRHDRRPATHVAAESGPARDWAQMLRAIVGLNLADDLPVATGTWGDGISLSALAAGAAGRPRSTGRL